MNEARANKAKPNGAETAEIVSTGRTAALDASLPVYRYN